MRAGQAHKCDAPKGRSQAQGSKREENKVSVSSKIKMASLAASVSAAALFSAAPAMAADLSLMFSANDNQTEVLTDLVERYKTVAPDVNIELNLVGYNVIREQLPVQLEAGTGPDIALITDLGGLNPYYIDLTPYVDADAWEANYGGTLPWYRAGKPGGIYAFHSEMTVTGPYINVTMFDDAGVDIPEPGATWEDWADATRAVMDETGSYAGMVMDRSGHRMAGPAMSYGAQYFDDDGNLIVDEGYRAFAQLMVDWHAEGLMPPDVWPAVSGSKYANGNEMFFNSDVPFYMSGSWNIGNVQRNVGDKFEWRVVPVPCGPAGCGVMPGGAGFAAFNHSENPEEAAKFVAWLGSDEIAREWYSRIFAIPAHSQIQADGIDYTAFGAGQEVSDGLNIYAAGAAKAQEQTPQAFQLQGHQFGFVIYNATTEYVAAVMNGDLDMDSAMERIAADIEEKTAE